MNSKEKIKKYQKALEIILFCVEHNPKVNLSEMRKELKLNKNFISALSKLSVIKNDGNRRVRNYILLKKYSPELALEVLEFANKASLNLKTPIIENNSIIENHFGTIEIKRTFLQRFFDFFKF